MAFSTCISQGRQQGEARRCLANSEWKAEHAFYMWGLIQFTFFDAQEIVGGFKPQEFPGGFGDSPIAPCAAGLCCKVISAPAALPAPHTQRHAAPLMAKTRMYCLERLQKIHFSFVIIFPQAKQLMAGLGENIDLCFQVIGCRFARLNPFKSPESHPFSL